MPETLKLDPITEHQLCEVIGDACHTRGFTLTDGAKLAVGELRPKEKSFLDDLKTRLDPYVDFQSGGLKLYEFDYRGAKGTFSVKPGWDFATPGEKGGPSVTLQFHLRF